jgi:alpha-glucosidase (family GH31 glycosyl hydrolase)
LQVPANNISIRLPNDGRWVYLFDQAKVFDGGTTVTMSFPYEEFPVFVREGTAVLNMLNKAL